MGAKRLSSDLEAMVAAVEVLSPSRYRIAGHPYRVEAAANDGAPGRDLIASLQDELYDRLYTRRTEGPGLRPGGAVRQAHQALLASANCGQGTWEPGWRVVAEGTEEAVVVERYGVRFSAAPDGVRCDNGRPEIGAACRVFVPAERREFLTGFYFIHGDADQSERTELPLLLRLYWNLRPEGAAPLVQVLTAGLNRRRVPFRLKVPSDPRHYFRADVGVLYLEPGDWQTARETVLQACGELRDGLRPEPPLLTLRLARGLGLAEGSPDGASFGEHRCRLIAEALVEAQARGESGMEPRVRAVAASFCAAGLDPLRPHLAPGSRARYRELELPVSDPRPEPLAAKPEQTAASFSQAAAAVGDRLCKTAWWHEGRCNWLGHDREIRDPVTREIVPTTAAMHADLYGGTAGIGLFLAELYGATGESTHRETAVAALRQALRAVEEREDLYTPLGFYAGWLGVAWAALRVARRTACAELDEGARRLLSRSLAKVGEDHVLDLIRGSAGAIACLLAWHRETGRPELLAAARALGEEIERSAEREEAAWRWTNGRVSGLEDDDPPLAGLAHGAAGLGLALLELFAACGGRRFLAGARGAFGYEQSLFDGERGNWPDLRDAAKRPPAEARQYMTAWCHGAPGIALSRLRAIEIDGDRASGYEPAARAGLDTTLRVLRESLSNGDALDTSLCHGLCGWVDVALVGAEVLEAPEARRQAEVAMVRLLESERELADWPSGTPSGGGNPSLMLGLAGVGYTLLRLSDPRQYATVLLPGVA